MSARQRFSGESANVSRLIEDLLRGYDKRLRPNYNGRPVEVGITMFVSSVSSISEVDMDFTLDFYFRQHWHDSRLQFRSSPDDELVISNEMLSKIWWPDTFFANAKLARFHDATTKNAFLRIKPSGHVTQSLRLTVTAMCHMDLTFFPMDTQTCPLEIESYAYDVKHIAYVWRDGRNLSVGIHKEGGRLPQFNVRGFRVTEKTELLSTGNYSRLSVELHFVRSLGYYIIQIYVPSSLIVVLSWLSFWLHRDASPARVSLGVTTVLTMTTLISSTNAALPKISYLKSIDVYLVTCFVMVFAAILEYAAVSYIAIQRPFFARRQHRKSTTSVECKSRDQRANTLQIVFASTATQPSVIAAKTSVTKLDSHHSSTAVPNNISPLHAGELRHDDVTGIIYRHPHVASSAQTEVNMPTDYEDLCNDRHVFPSYHHHADRDHGVKRSSHGHPCRTAAGDGYSTQHVTTKPSPGAVDYNVIVATNIDRYSRVVFPVAFTVLSAIYWMIYLNISQAGVMHDFVVVHQE